MDKTFFLWTKLLQIFSRDIEFFMMILKHFFFNYLDSNKEEVVFDSVVGYALFSQRTLDDVEI